ncbi:hypothetical protein FGB62_91g010 [Gracilaria domingensis]|nr:hypothetical protein FGB62_91g010 [Gracilaria domingensis]
MRASIRWRRVASLAARAFPKVSSTNFLRGHAFSPPRAQLARSVAHAPQRPLASPPRPSPPTPPPRWAAVHQRPRQHHHGEEKARHQAAGQEEGAQAGEGVQLPVLRPRGKRGVPHLQDRERGPHRVPPVRRALLHHRGQTGGRDRRVLQVDRRVRRGQPRGGRRRGRRGARRRGGAGRARARRQAFVRAG